MNIESFTPCFGEEGWVLINKPHGYEYGGDFYIFTANSESVWFILADCEDHGESGYAIQEKVRPFFEKVAESHPTSSQRFRDEILAEIGNDINFVKFVCAVISNGQVELAFWRNDIFVWFISLDNIQEFEGNPQHPVPVFLAIQETNRIIFFTDWLPKQRFRNKFRNLLENNYSLKNIEFLTNRLLENQIQDDNPPIPIDDDLTLIGFDLSNYT